MLSVSMDSHFNSLLTKRQEGFPLPVGVGKTPWKGCYWPAYDHVQPMAREVEGRLLAHCDSYSIASYLTNEVCSEVRVWSLGKLSRPGNLMRNPI